MKICELIVCLGEASDLTQGPGGGGIEANVQIRPMYLKC